VVISALLHPLRVFLIKGDSTPEGLTLSVVIIFGFMSFFQIILMGINPWKVFEIWPLIAISSLGLLLHFWCIVKSLRVGDFSVNYPIIRSSPLFVVVVGYIFLNHDYSMEILLGIAIVIISSFMIQYTPGGKYFSKPASLLLAVLAMCFHGVLTLADAEAMKYVEPAAFLFIQYLFVTPAMALMFVLTRPSGKNIYEYLFLGWKNKPLRFFLAGFTAYISYLLILYSFRMGANVAAVSAIRQISIPFSVLMGGFFLLEKKMNYRLFWSLLLTFGVIIIIVSS
jgi:drug/metabolite transporter (DMT)-like permease